MVHASALKHRSWFVGAVVLWAPCAAVAQGPATLTGQVVLRGPQTPLGGAGVRVMGQANTTTDENGRFELAALPEGAVQVELVDPRVDPLTQDLVLHAGTQSITLWATPAAASELVATYRTSEDVQRPTWHIDKTEIRLTPGTMGDPVRAVQNRAGVIRTPFDAGWILMRGGDFDHTGLFVDGVPVPSIFHLGGFTSVLHPPLVDRVEIYPGVPPTRLGESIAGAVEVGTARLADDLQIDAGVNTVFAHAFVQTPGEHVRVGVGARRSYLDALLRLAVGEQASSIAPRFWDTTVRVETDRSTWTLIALDDAFDAPTVATIDAIATIRARGLQVFGQIEAGSWTVSPYVVLRERSTQSLLLQQRLTELTPVVRADHRSQHGEAEVVAGGELRQLNNTLVTDGRRIRRPGAAGAAHLSTSAGRQVKPWVGLRADGLWISEQALRGSLSPRAGLSVTAGPWTLRNELGRMYRSPRTHLMIGVPDGEYLPLESADAASVAVEFGRSDAQLGAAAFTRSMRDLGGYESDGSLGTSTGQAHGVELTSHWMRGPVDARLTYAYTRSTRQQDPDLPVEAWTYDQPHRLLAVTTFKLPKRWALSMRGRVSSGFPAPGPMPDGTDTLAFDLLTGASAPLNAPIGSRLPPFYAFDLKVHRSFLQRTWSLDLFLDIQNITNRRVPEPVITGFGEALPAYGYGLPVLPVFGVDGTFWPRHARDAATSSE
jgi:hypothetical protein